MERRAGVVSDPTLRAELLWVVAGVGHEGQGLWAWAPRACLAQLPKSISATYFSTFKTASEVSLSALGSDANHHHKTKPDKHAQHYSVRSERYRYIRSASGQEELYDMKEDPHCWTNIAGDPEMKPMKENLFAQMMELIDRREPYEIFQCWIDPQER